MKRLFQQQLRASVERRRIPAFPSSPPEAGVASVDPRSARHGRRACTFPCTSAALAIAAITLLTPTAHAAPGRVAAWQAACGLWSAPAPDPRVCQHRDAVVVSDALLPAHGVYSQQMVLYLPGTVTTLTAWLPAAALDSGTNATPGTSVVVEVYGGRITLIMAQGDEVALTQAAPR